MIQSAIDYAQDLQRGLRGRPRDAASRGEQVACGVTAPARQQQPDQRPPVGLAARVPHARRKKAGLKRFDAWAHHPYYGGADRDADDAAATANGGAPTAITLGNISIADRPRSTQLYGAKPIWITEYGYQTNPPDRTSASPGRSRRAT